MQQEFTVGTWVQQWFEQGLGNWKPSTVGGYRNLIERHIIPGIGNVKLEKLKPIHIHKFYALLAENDLSTRTIWCVHLLLRRCLDATCKDCLIGINPANFCEIPVTEKLPTLRLRTSQIQRYLSAAQDAGVLPIIYIGLTVGLRQCELFTLLWADFNLERRYILRGKRLLKLNDKAIALLETEHSQHPNSPYTFLNPKNGKPYQLHEFYYLHRKLSQKARLPKLGFRDLQAQCMEVKLHHTRARWLRSICWALCWFGCSGRTCSIWTAMECSPRFWGARLTC